MPPPPKPPKQPKFNTLTTAGRIAKAAHTREQAAMKSTPTSPPPEDSAPPKKKNRKIPVLAPPAELEAEAARRAEAKKKPKPKPKKAPLTTKDKIAASKKKKKKKQNFGPGEDDEKGFRGGRGGEAKTKGEKPRNLMDIMRDLGQMGSKAPVSAASTVAGKVQTVASNGAKVGAKGKAKVKESVLVRPTERTRRMQQSRQRLGETQTAPTAPSANIKCEDDDGASSNTRASLMGLSIELRQQILRLAVVESQYFVYPAINQEQPDLAMTSRQIRNEVLSLYYGENVFAIEIPVPATAGMSKKAKDPERKSLLLVKKWTAALEDHLGTIRKWALSWAPPPVKDVQAGVRGHTGDREFIVSICYHKPGEYEQATRPEIEIHRQAFCVLKSHELFQPCISMCYPSWLDDAVAAAVLTEGQDRGKQILMIAKDVEKRGGELVGSRCEDGVVELD